MDSVSCDILSSIIIYLADEDYLQLSWTCRHLYYALRSNYILRVLFRHRGDSSLTPNELQIGLTNLMRYRTVMYSMDKVLINYYLRILKDNYLLDIFHRVHYRENMVWHRSEIHSDEQSMGLMSDRSFPRCAFVRHEEIGSTLIITGESLTPLHELHYLRVYYLGEVVLYQQWGRDMIYFPYRGGFPYTHHVSASEVVYIRANAPYDWIDVYDIYVVLNRQGELFLGSDLIATQVVEIRHRDWDYVWRTQSDELYLSSCLRKRSWHLIDTQVSAIVQLSNDYVLYLSEDKTFKRYLRISMIKQTVAKNVIFAHDETRYIDTSYRLHPRDINLPEDDRCLWTRSGSYDLFCYSRRR